MSGDEYEWEPDEFEGEDFPPITRGVLSDLSTLSDAARGSAVALGAIQLARRLDKGECSSADFAALHRELRITMDVLMAAQRGDPRSRTDEVGQAREERRRKMMGGAG